MIQNLDNPTRAFFGLPTSPDRVEHATFIRVDGKLQRYAIDAFDHIDAIRQLEREGVVGQILSPVLVLLENNSIHLTIVTTD